MANWQAWARWAAALLAAPGCSSKPEPSQSNTGQAAKKGVSTAPVGSQAEPAKELNLDLGGGVTMKLVLIPAGKFLMGSPTGEAARRDNETQHEVTISKPFYMGETEVTKGQYEAVKGATNPRERRADIESLGGGRWKVVIGRQYADRPADRVSWNDATEFCRKLSEKTRQTVRLPTEAEWEDACRAVSTTRFSFGDADEDLGDFAWYIDNSGDGPHAVGQKKPNAWGLYDMHGNMGEWCADWHADYPEGAVTDPQGPASGTFRVLRGAAWSNHSYICRSAYRYFGIPDHRNYYVGFRVVVSVSAPGL